MRNFYQYQKALSRALNLGERETLARSKVMLECEDQKKLAQYRRKTHLWKRIVSVLLAIGLAVFLICGIYIYFVKSQPLEITMTDTLVIYSEKEL